MSHEAKTYYNKNYTALYGANTDFKGAEDKVKFLESVTIVGLPHMMGSQRIVWTTKGNFHLFENKSKEYFDLQFEQEDRKLKAWGDSKEGFHAIRVGKKCDTAAEQSYNTQWIFCNDVDMPEAVFVDMVADDTTPSAKLHTSMQSVENTVATAITNIDDVIAGQKVILKCGSDTNAPTIANSGNFVLSAAWAPSLNDTITLMKRSDGKFIEIARTVVTSTATAFTADDVTPSVDGNTNFETVANSKATAITDFDDAEAEVLYTIYGGSDTFASTIANAGNFVLTAAMTLGDGKWIKLIKSASNSKFYEVDRDA
jgi:hypothetical protein